MSDEKNEVDYGRVAEKLGWNEAPALKGADELTCYFHKLDFGVTWDADRAWFDSRGASGHRWYEIYEAGIHGKLLCQITYGTPLAAVLEDLPLFAEGKPGTSKSNYDITCMDLADLRLIVEKISSLLGAR